MPGYPPRGCLLLKSKEEGFRKDLLTLYPSHSTSYAYKRFLLGPSEMVVNAFLHFYETEAFTLDHLIGISL